MAPASPKSTRRRVLAGVLALAALVLLAFAGLYVRKARRPSPLPALPHLASGAVEGCLACHAGVQGLGAEHEPGAIGCSPCHLGDPAARTAEDAHRDMERSPGELSSIYATCGRSPCHVVEAARVTSSLMARAPGILAVDRFAFGESASPEGDKHDGLDDIDPTRPGGSVAESHVRKLCGSCHLGARKEKPGDQGFFARGGGCVACHLAPPRASEPGKRGPLHPDVSAVVSEQRCVGCHSRSGRVALSYRGVVELEPGDPRVNAQLPDGRPVGAASPDVHAKAGMTCIDCHTEREVMGDGEKHRHAHEALEIRCADCHAPGPTPPPDQDSARVAIRLRESWERRHLPPLSSGPPLRTGRGTELWRTDASARSLALVTTGEQRAIPAASVRPYHRMHGHERLDCQACHSSWAPRCTQCHTTFDKNGQDLDHLSGAITAGHWSEEAGGNGLGPPLLAVGPRGTIGPFVEGMTFRLDGVGVPLERTLWAPLEPHTTGASRSCASCHAEESLDHVYPRAGETTRASARLLDAGERARIAEIGPCLACHGEYADPIYVDFALSLRRLRTRAPGDRAIAGCRGAVR